MASQIADELLLLNAAALDHARENHRAKHVTNARCGPHAPVYNSPFYSGPCEQAMMEVKVIWDIPTEIAVIVGKDLVCLGDDPYLMKSGSVEI